MGSWTGPRADDGVYADLRERVPRELSGLPFITTYKR